MPNQNWLSIANLSSPFNDAHNYKGVKDKEFFNRIFLRTEQLKEILSPHVYYLMGEKGTGKTAYATYLQNNNEDNTKCQVTTMTETQYKRFIEMKRNGKLAYSDYANIWRSMLLFVVSQMVIDKSKNFFNALTGKFEQIESEVAKWKQYAMHPELETAFEAISSQTLSGSIGSDKVAKVGGDIKEQETDKFTHIQHNLLDTENSLRAALAALKLSRNHVLFIDGIDYRPEHVGYREYIECIKGLSEAFWQLNTDFFSSIKDSKGRIKIVLLVRPDVFHALNVYNSNSRLQDNTVFLNWATPESEFAQSRLFEVSGRYFANQQNFKPTSADAWNHYYENNSEYGAVFKRLLKITFQRPRDVLTFIRITRGLTISSGQGSHNTFPKDISTTPAFTRDFADYLLGEFRNYAAFYMTPQDFSNYLKFFQFLNGKPNFKMKDFEDAFGAFKKWAEGEIVNSKEYLRDAEALLQFFYDTNVIGYREELNDGGPSFFHWSYRERSPNNISPKVKTSGDLILNIGIAKALDVGKTTRSSPRTNQTARKSPVTRNKSSRKK